MKAKIRGIYSTALTKMLLNNGFEVVQPSSAIKKRFGLQNDSALPNIKIRDRYDLQGVRVLGTLDTVNTFQSILHSALDDVLTRKWTISVDGIYKGKLRETKEAKVYIDLGNEIVGWLPKREYAKAEDKLLLVQVERKRIGAKQPLLTTNLKIVGDYAILTQNSRIGVSLKIHDQNKRAELYTLGKTLAPERWGIIWRELSAYQQREILEKEIAKLTEQVRILNEKAAHANAPSLLIEGSYFMDVEFPWLSKKNLDMVRASIAPTLDGHHFYKTCGGAVSSTLEMAEKLLEEGQDKNEVEKLFRERVLCEFPEEGSQIDVEHVKLSGIVFYLGEATIENISEEQIKYSRIMRRSGIYDGLGTKKEVGDKAISETKTGEWHITTKYFSSSGEWKGTYINLNTPVEVYPKAIRYVDLEVDICLCPDGTVKVLDMEKLEKAKKKGFISNKFFQTVKEKSENLKESIA